MVRAAGAGDLCHPRAHGTGSARLGPATHRLIPLRRRPAGRGRARWRRTRWASRSSGRCSVGGSRSWPTTPTAPPRAAAPTITESCEVDWPVVAGIAQVESRHGRIDPDHRLACGRRRRAANPRPLARRDARHADDRRYRRRRARRRCDLGPRHGPAPVHPDHLARARPRRKWRRLGGSGQPLRRGPHRRRAPVPAGAGRLRDRGELRRALIAYNASGRYADDVLRWVDRYRSGPIDEILERPSERGLSLSRSATRTRSAARRTSRCPASSAKVMSARMAQAPSVIGTHTRSVTSRPLLHSVAAVEVAGPEADVGNGRHLPRGDRDAVAHAQRDVSQPLGPAGR